MALLGNLTVGILGNMSGLSNTFRGAQSEVQRFGSRLQSVGRDISSVGDTLTRRITMPAIAAGSALAGITLVKGFNRLVGIDTAQAKLKALGHDAKSVESIMTSALDSVKGTAFGLDEAAITAANAIAAGIPPGKELTRYLSLTGDAAAIAGASMGEMGSIINTVATSGKAYNGELQQLSDRGLPIYQWLAKEANTTADAIFDMASKGQISTDMLLNAIEKNIGGAAKTMGEESFTAAIANIGADIARIGANFLDAGGKAGGFFSTVKPLLTEFREWLSSVEGKAADWGETFGKVFIGFIDRIRDLKSRFDELSPSIQSAILKAAGIGAAVLVGIGPALKILGTLISVVGSVIGAVSGAGGLGAALASVAGPVGIAIAVIAGLIAVGIAVWKNWDTVKEKLVTIFKNFSPLFETLKGSFQTLIDSLGPIWENLKKLFESLKPALMAIGMVVGGVIVTAFGLLISIVSAVVSAVGPLINAIINLVDMLINIFYSLILLLTGDFSGAWEYWQKAGESGVEFVKSLWEGVVNFFSTFIDTIVDFFSSLYTTLVGNSIIPDMVNAIVEWFHNMFGWLINIVRSIIDGVKDRFETMKNIIRAVMETAKSIISAVWTYIQNTFQNALKFLSSLVRGDFQGMRNAISNQMQNARNLLSNIWSAIRSNMSQVLSNILLNVQSRFQNMVSAVKERITNVRTAIRDGMNQALDIVRNIGKRFKDAGKNIVQSIADGIKGAVGRVTGAMRDVANKIRDYLPFSPAKIGPLKDIHRLDFAGPMSESLERAVALVNRRMEELELPNLNGAGQTQVLSGHPEYVQVHLHLNGREIMQAVAKPLAQQQNRINRRNTAARGLNFP